MCGGGEGVVRSGCVRRICCRSTGSTPKMRLLSASFMAGWVLCQWQAATASPSRPSTWHRGYGDSPIASRSDSARRARFLSIGSYTCGDFPPLSIRSMMSPGVIPGRASAAQKSSCFERLPTPLPKPSSTKRCMAAILSLRSCRSE